MSSPGQYVGALQRLRRQSPSRCRSRTCAFVVLPLLPSVASVVVMQTTCRRHRASCLGPCESMSNLLHANPGGTVLRPSIDCTSQLAMTAPPPYQPPSAKTRPACRRDARRGLSSAVPQLSLPQLLVHDSAVTCKSDPTTGSSIGRAGRTNHWTVSSDRPSRRPFLCNWRSSLYSFAD